MYPVDPIASWCYNRGSPNTSSQPLPFSIEPDYLRKEFLGEKWLWSSPTWFKVHFNDWSLQTDKKQYERWKVSPSTPSSVKWINESSQLVYLNDTGKELQWSTCTIQIETSGYTVVQHAKIDNPIVKAKSRDKKRWTNMVTANAERILVEWGKGKSSCVFIIKCTARNTETAMWKWKKDEKIWANTANAIQISKKNNIQKTEALNNDACPGSAGKTATKLHAKIEWARWVFCTFDRQYYFLIHAAQAAMLDSNQVQKKLARDEIKQC